jgi:alpha-tubulin suppressor-like RCC1 family protein
LRLKDKTIPTKILGLDKVDYISAGAYHSLAVLKDNSVRT